MEIVKEPTPYSKYSLVSEYSEELVTYCRFLRQSLGYTEFFYQDGRWRFNDPAIVLMLLKKYPNLKISDEISKEVGIYEEKKEAQIKQEQITSSIKDGISTGMEITGIKGELYPYQKLGVEFFVHSKGKALLADEPGTGKTLQSLAYLVTMSFKRSIVIAPASVKFVWEAEAKKWTNLKTFVVEPDSDLDYIPHDTNLVIINYDLLAKHFNELMKYKWDCLIADEAHYIKSEKAKRSKLVKALASQIPSVIMLTGTPILSRPIEIFNLLTIIDPKTWGSWYQFAVRYCGGHQSRFGFEAKGATNIEELKQRINKYFLRRRKEDVLDQLPPKTFIDIPVDLSKDARHEYDLAEEDLVRYLHEYKKDKAKSIVSAMQAEQLVRLNILRQLSSRGKIETAKQMIEDIMDAGEKVIVFSCFKEPLIQLFEEFSDNAVMITGDTSMEDRKEAVERFQNTDYTKVFFGGIKSAGVGITLTAATNVIFLDFSWVPSDHIQAQDRMHRPGQKATSVNIYQLIGRSTTDAFMQKLLLRKQQIFNQLIEGNEVETQSSIIEEMISDMKQRHAI